ncbi:MAG TPA: hypothetical protein VEW92_04590 [Nitrososphaeraceae archaeon]|nr:hypothetical protein [Nitrososphaeraceae archaeon]
MIDVIGSLGDNGSWRDNLQDVHEINNDIKKRRGRIDGYDYEYEQLNMNSAYNLKKTENNNNDMDYNGNSYC